MQKDSWAAVDWGTTNLRAYLIAGDGTVVDEVKTPKGMGQLRSDEFEAALISAVEPWLTDATPIPDFACGMVGARQGWQEAPYLTVPCPPVSADRMTRVRIQR